MQYRGQKSSLSKLEYAQLVACSLAYLVITQQDSAGLVAFSNAIDDWLPPSSAASQFDDMIRVMEKMQGKGRTRLPQVLSEVTQRIRRPSLIVLISDMLDDVDELLQSLKMVRHAGHDLVLLQVLDEEEITFPFDQMSRFEGLEDLLHVMTDPLLIAGSYRRAMAEFQKRIRIGCQQMNADYFLLRTDESLATTLPRILASRAAKRS